MIKATKEGAKFLKSTVRLPTARWPYRPSVSDIAKYLPRCTDDLYAWQNRHRPAADTFTLHDGPPYANGALHVGHALNKIVKDIICRTKLAEGRRIDFVPGWDCHGLPIEQKVFKEKGWTREDGYDALKVRTVARKFAYDTVKRQMKGFRSWVVMADWENHWKTLDREFELRQLEVFKVMVQNGLIYRKHKPVHWSPSSGTALAEAEIEYDSNHTSTTALVKFPFFYGPLASNTQPVSAVIWTTTPWTIPANQAIAINRNLVYVMVQSQQHGRLVFASSRLQYAEEKLGERLEILHSVTTQDLLSSAYNGLSVCGEEAHNRPVFHADFVKSDSGTGLVHCAPGHGKDDYDALQSLIASGKVQVKAPVNDQGNYTSTASPADPKALAGLNVYTEGSRKVLDILKDDGLLLATWKFRHSYPIDWRTKEPVMTRATAQWFADVSSIRTATLAALERVEFKPDAGKARLRSFIENRGEWCISRQRAWGVPIPALYHRETGDALLNADSINHIISVIKDRGINAWWADEPDDAAWVPAGYSATQYMRGTDTMDVWFDSGTSWTLMQNDRGSANVADLYLEGSDQHRGWFQSSLLTNIAYQVSSSPNQEARAPFRTLVTHGFTLDENARKMSKSEGNVVDPEEIIAGFASRSKAAQNRPSKVLKDTAGPDALRLWAASSDWTKDVVVSDQIVDAVHKSLKTYRNVFKLLLGSLKDFDPDNVVAYQDMSQLDQIALLHLWRIVESVRRAFADFEFHKGLALLNRWMASDLSGFYIEATKDSLYCDSVTSQRRRSVITTFHHIFGQLQHMLAPITPLLIEETFELSPTLLQAANEHPHKRVWNPAPSEWNNKQHALALPRIMSIKSAMNAASERARSQRGLGKSLEINVCLALSNDDVIKAISDETLQEILVVSNLRRVSAEEGRSIAQESNNNPDLWAFTQPVDGTQDNAADAIIILRASEGECARCWNRVIPSSRMQEAEMSQELPLCRRCVDVVAEHQPV